MDQSGYDVRVESQNAFQPRGHSAILAGKPDLLVLNKNRILITDFKFAGEIVYNDRTERVPQGGIDQGFVRNLGSLIRRIAAPEPPVRVPSAQECRFCDITPKTASNASRASPTPARRSLTTSDRHQPPPRLKKKSS